MIKKFKIKSDFAKNVVTLMTGTTISQAIPIAISPILTRIYTPKDFGVLALFIGLTSILSIIATGRYELAIMLPKKEDSALHIATLAMLISFFISIFMFIIVFAFNEEIVLLLKNKDISMWLYWVPLSVFIISCYQSLNFLNIRKKQFKNTATSKVIQSSTISGMSVLLGGISLKNIGLVTGQMLGQFIALLYLLRNSILYCNFDINKIKKIKLFALAKRYKNFPIIVTFTGVLNTASIQIPVFIITSLFSIKIAGFYSLAQRITTLPNALIAVSIGQVFYQEVAKKATIKEKALLLNNTINKLLKISAPIFAFLFIFGGLIFSFVFGKNWYIAGEYAQIMSFWLYMVFLVSPLSQLYNILEKQKTFLFLNIMSFILRLISLLIGGLFFKDVEITLYLFVASSAFSWFVILGLMMKYLNLKPYKIISNIFIYFIFYAIVFKFLNIVLKGVFNALY